MRVKLENILSTTDFSDFSNYTIPYGIAMAEEFGAKLYVCHIIEMHTAGLYAEASLDPLAFQKQQMNFLKEQCDQSIGHHAIEWEPLVSIGYPPDEIARMVEEHQVDLVISATHGRSGIKRLILGSVTERLMRTLPCPLLVVISGEEDLETAAGKEFRLKRIMVGCDFSPDSSLAFQYALSFAQEFQSDLHLVHVVEPSVYDNAQRMVRQRKGSSGTQLRDLLKTQLSDMIPEESRNWCMPVITILEGRPYEELVRYATLQNIDMIFLGIRGRGLIETYLVGSTTDRVVRHSPCPVFSAHPKSPGTEDRG